MKKDLIGYVRFHGGSTYEDEMDNRICQMLYDYGDEWNYLITGQLEDGRWAVETEEWENPFDPSTSEWVVYCDLVADTLDDLVLLLEKRNAEKEHFYNWETGEIFRKAQAV